MKTKIGTVAVGTVLALAASALAQQGVKQTERLVKRAEDTVKADRSHQIRAPEDAR